MFFTRARFIGLYFPNPVLTVWSGLLAILLIALAPVAAMAQAKDTSNTTFVELSAENVFGFKTDSGDVSKFIGNAVFHQGTDTLYCDSLYQFKATNIIEAFSNVRIAQAGGTQGKSDYLRYKSAEKLAYMHGNVSLTDGKNDLRTEDLTYNMGTKIGTYDNGGILHNDSTTVTSRSGVYSVNTKIVRFTGNAVITDPEYNIHSEDLEYFTETKVTRFYARSTVVSDSGKNVLNTSSGTYDGKKGIAHFIGHSSIWNDGEYIEGDSLDYDKQTGYGLGNGHVITIDTAHKSTMFCGHAEYFHKSRVLWATIKPVLRQVNGKDTFYMRGDTFYSAPMVKVKIDTTKPKAKVKKKDDDEPADTTMADVKSFVKKVKKSADTVAEHKPVVIDTSAMVRFAVPTDSTLFGLKKRDTTRKIKRTDTAALKPPPDFMWAVPSGPKFRKGDMVASRTLAAVETPAAPVLKRTKKKITKGAVTVTDTVMADTTAPMYFIAWHHVKLFSDSMQGKCDSVCYTRSDSTIRMINDPIVWAHNSQITGDTILLYLDSNELNKVFVPNNSLVVSQSGPPKAGLFDQVQGKTLTAHFKNNAVTDMEVIPDAECIYYSKDEHDAYMGVDQASSVRMLIYFEDQKIVNIKFHKDVSQVMTPMEKADIPNTKLSRFKWLPELKPKNKEELFE